MRLQHLNLAGLAGNHPLRGPNLENFGVRFPALSDAYDLDLRHRVHNIWKQVDRSSESRRLHEGTYAFVGGPRYPLRPGPTCITLKLNGIATRREPNAGCCVTLEQT